MAVAICFLYVLTVTNKVRTEHITPKELILARGTFLQAYQPMHGKNITKFSFNVHCKLHNGLDYEKTNFIIVIKEHLIERSLLNFLFSVSAVLGK